MCWNNKTELWQFIWFKIPVNLLKIQICYIWNFINEFFYLIISLQLYLITTNTTLTKCICIYCVHVLMCLARFCRCTCRDGYIGNGSYCYGNIMEVEYIWESMELWNSNFKKMHSCVMECNAINNLNGLLWSLYAAK